MNIKTSNFKFKKVFNKYRSHFRRHGGTESTAANAFFFLGWNNKDEQTRQKFRAFVNGFGEYRKSEIVNDKETAAFILACVELGYFDDVTDRWHIITVNELNRIYILPINASINEVKL